MTAVSFSSRPLYPQYLLNSRMGRLSEEEKINLLLLLGIETRCLGIISRSPVTIPTFSFVLCALSVLLCPNCPGFCLSSLLCNTNNTNIQAPGKIRTRNPSKQAATDPRLRPLGYWDRHWATSAPWLNAKCWWFALLARLTHNHRHLHVSCCRCPSRTFTVVPASMQTANGRWWAVVEQRIHQSQCSVQAAGWTTRVRLPADAESCLCTTIRTYAL